MRLTDSEIKTVARGAGISEKAVVRLIGSLRITLPRRAAEVEESTPTRKELDVGLRLQSAEILAPLTLASGREEVLRRITDALRQYFSACANVCAWIGRGDFRSDRMPELITRGMLVHACRTAGRLRAKTLRCQ